jgi:hypothetical protein
MAVTTDPAPRPVTRDDLADMAMPVRAVLATCSLAAGVVHLVMVPVHADNAVDATGFAVFGWLQVLLAVGVLVRPSRFLVGATVAVNAAAAAMWAWSRTTGLPFGGHAGEAEEVGFVDGLTAAFGATAAAGGLLLLWRPRLGARLSEPVLVVGSLIPVAALVATSVALADPSLTTHSHDEGELAAGHLHGTGADHDAEMAAIAANRCDLDINPAAYWQETTLASVDTIMGGTHGGDDHGTTVTTRPALRGSPELDRLIAATAREGGEVKDSQVIVELSKVDDETYRQWLAWLPTYSAMAHEHSSAAAPDDNAGHGGHLGPQPWIAMTDPAECDQLRAELAQAREVAMRYPKAADAVAAGWVKVTPYLPGIAAHYMKFSAVDGVFDIGEPEMLLYDGDGPEASMVGLSYYLIHDSDVEPTQGFTGPNDHFHRHIGLCIGRGGVIGDSTLTEEECAAIGGRKASGEGGWMNHVWVVPGCESPWGMFSGASPLLDDTLKQRSGTDGGGCAGSGVRDRYDLSPGSALNTPTTVRGVVEAAAAD